MRDEERTLAGIRRNIIDRHQRAEMGLYLSSEYDFLRSNAEFQQMMAIVDDDLSIQRERIRELERNGEMPKAPGVKLVQ